MTAQDGGLEVRYDADGKWAAIPVWEDDDPQPWVEGVVRAYLKRRRVKAKGPELTVLVQAWAAIVEDVRSRRRTDDTWMAAACAFVPMGSRVPADLLPMTVAHVVGVESPLGRDAFVDSLVAPVDERVGDPLVDGLETRSGGAVRVRQLLLDPRADGRDAGLGCSLVYVWSTPDPGRLLTLDAWFGVPSEAELVLPSFDALAATVELTLT